MKTTKSVSLAQQYKSYATYGAAALLSAWLIALLTTTVLPGPYYLDFFGVVAERTANTTSVTVSWISFLSAFVFLPAVMMIVDYLKSNKFK